MISTSLMIIEIWSNQKFDSTKLLALFSLRYDSPPTKLSSYKNISSLSESSFPIPNNHASLYASFEDLPSSLSRTHLNEPLMTSIDVSSLSRNWRSWETFKSFDKRSLEICEIIESLPKSSSNTRPLLKHHVEPSYAKTCLSQFLWTCIFSEQFFQSA